MIITKLSNSLVEISARQIDRKFGPAVEKATLLARTHAAAYLPGFSGREVDHQQADEDTD